MTTPHAHDLSSVDATGWYERLLESLSEAEVLVEVFGPRGLGYLVLTGGRVESVAYDPQDAMGSVVDLRLPDGRVGRGPARLVVRRAIELVADQVMLPGPAPESLDEDALRAFLGPRFVLAAAMHGLRLVHLVERGGGVEIGIESEDDDGVESVELPLGEARAAVRALVLEDLRGLDGAVVDDALRAAVRDAEARGDARTVVSLLEPVVGPIVSSLRTAPVESRSPDDVESLVAVVLSLAKAYLTLSDPESAETVLRVSAQGLRGAEASAPLYTLLGELALDRGEPGEAVGYLRRALTLEPAALRPAVALARALELRGRAVAAYFLLERALGASSSPSGPAAQPSTTGADSVLLDVAHRTCARLRTSLGAPLEQLLELRGSGR